MLKPFSVSADVLHSGELLETAENIQKDKKHLSFFCELDSLGNGKLLIGHGFETTYGSWLEITADSVAAYTYYSFHDPSRFEILPPTPHGLQISAYIGVTIDVDVARGGTIISVASSSGIFKTERNVQWYGWNGSVFASPQECTLRDARLNWFTDSFSKKIWIFGASYLGLTKPSRWPYYLYRDGRADNTMICGFGGMKAKRGLEELKWALTQGKPEYVLWHLGGNDADFRRTEKLSAEQLSAMTDNFTLGSEDSGSEINPHWLESIRELLSICEQNGITPILTTMPSNPLVDHEGKNRWVRNSGYRYVDIARAVGAHKYLNWYPGMISADNVHPTPAGAAAMYMRVLSDFPEIMEKC